LPKKIDPTRTAVRLVASCLLYDRQHGRSKKSIRKIDSRGTGREAITLAPAPE